jgi:AraC family ethanolamine operon transcriptional activator
MEVIESLPTMPATADLARRIGINDRTLLRTFRETFGMPPKKYLMLRELHIMRRLLTARQEPDATVAAVLSGRGIWEFGRFAGRYREHFGELPSQTLERVHG